MPDDVAPLVYPVQLVVRQSGVEAEVARLVAARSATFRSPGETLALVPSLLHVGAYHGDLLIGHVGLVLSAVRHRGAVEEVAGIGSLLVAEEYRGRGIGGMLLRSTAALAADWDVGGQLTFCDPALSGFYRTFGFSLAGPDVVVGQPGGVTAPLPPQLIAMWHPLADPTRRIGAFELLGLPF